ncbi:hypothetical protein ACIRD6_13400 [Streptomyces sp. NPDC102473]|uniref:hypothetical protein n=1 Tax=Streptomyces sp. NPDC102473 TaxID=3366180 RepID=UPI00381E028D
MSIDAYDLELQQLLAAPSLAKRILEALASSLQNEDPFQPLTLDTLNETLGTEAYILTDGVPIPVATDATERAARALPSIHDQETADAYALRVLQAARTV